ncbi:MAG: insulinase family protein [Planctomycetes bacterium]|nr:insulinase family protein [Planctomycetota bacterium]
MKAAVSVVLALCLLVSITQVTFTQSDPTPKAEKLDRDTGIKVEEFTLDNGLKLLVIPKPTVPVVSTYVWYKVGSIDETPGRTGMAHFLEHMMFKGSKNYKVGEVDRVTVRNGGSNNAFTSFDYTGYYIDLPKSRYHEALKIEADRMAHLTLDLSEFDAEKKVVQSESDISADNPNGRMWMRLNNLLHGKHHVYAHPILGWPQDISDCTRRDMRLFYDAHYHPNHATIVLSGDITGKEALADVKKMFDSIPRGPELKRPKLVDIPFKGPIEIEEKSDSQVVQFGREYLTVEAGHKDEAALEVLGSVLGGGVTSRLYKQIVEQDKIATSIGSGHWSRRLAGMFSVWGILKQGRSRVELKGAISAVVSKLIEEGPTEKELARTRNSAITNAVFAQESASGLAQIIGQAETVENDWRRVLGYPERIRAVTADDVKRVAIKYLKESNSVTGWLVPELTSNKSGETTDASPRALPIKRVVLPNGVRILMIERRDLPVVSATANFRVSRAAEPEGMAGIASFTGSMLDVGTENYSKQELAEAIEAVGGTLSVSVSGANFRVMAEHTDLGLKLMAEVLLRPTFPEDEITLARSQVLAAIEGNKNNTANYARQAANASLYGANKPLGQPSQGRVDTVSKFDSKTVAGWWGHWYRPDNCIIAIVGDFDTDEMAKKIEAEFGKWKSSGAPLRFPELEFVDPVRDGTQEMSAKNFDNQKVETSKKRVTVALPAKDQVVVMLRKMGVTRAHPDYYPLVVMDSILGTSPGFTDRFSSTLRDKMGLAYSTYANIANGSGLYPGSFMGYIGTRAENVETALKVMYQLIEEISTQPVSAEELSSAKDYLKGSFVFDTETTQQVVSQLIEIERYNLTANYPIEFAKAIDAVTIEDVMRVAKKHLDPAKMVEVMAGPVSNLPPAKDIAPKKEEK